MRGKLRSKGRAVQGVQAGPVKRVLSAEELGTLIKWLPNFSKAVADALTLYLWTCTRGSEIMAMEVSEISEETDGLWWTIPKAKTKNSWREHATDLRVPLVGRAEVVVRRRMDAAKGTYLFASRGKVPYMEQKSVGVAVWFHMPYSQSKPEDLRPRLPVTNLGATRFAAQLPHATGNTGMYGRSRRGGTGTYEEGCRRRLQPACLRPRAQRVAGSAQYASGGFVNIFFNPEVNFFSNRTERCQMEGIYFPSRPTDLIS